MKYLFLLLLCFSAAAGAADRFVQVATNGTLTYPTNLWAANSNALVAAISGAFGTNSGTGDVVGPAAAIDNALALFSGTSGKLVKASTLTEANLLTEAEAAVIYAPLDSPAFTGTVTFDSGEFGTLTVTTNLFVADVAYGPSWDQSTNVPTRNAVYDKIQSLLTLFQATNANLTALAGLNGGSLTNLNAEPLNANKYQATNAALTALASDPQLYQSTNAALTALAANPQLYQSTNAALTALAANPQLYQSTNAALTALAANPQLYQSTNAALTALAANPQLYQATNAALTALAANPQLYQSTNAALTALAANPSLYQLSNSVLTTVASGDASGLTTTGGTNSNQLVNLGQLNSAVNGGVVSHFNLSQPAGGFALTGTIGTTNLNSTTAPATATTNVGASRVTGDYVAAFITTNTVSSIASGLAVIEVYAFENAAGSPAVSAELYLVNATTKAEQLEATPAPAYQTVFAGTTPTKLQFSIPLPDYTSTTNFYLAVKLKQSGNGTVKLVTGGAYDSHLSFSLPASSFQTASDVLTSLASLNGTGLTNVMGYSGYFTSGPVRLVPIGDSLTAGASATTNYPYFLTNRGYITQANWVVPTNVGVANRQISQILSAYYTNDIQYLKPAGGTNAIAMLWAGVNDVQGNNWSGETTFGHWSNLVVQMRADGFKILAITVTPAATHTSSNVVAIMRYNEMIRDSPLWDWLYDAANEMPAPPVDTFYADSIHFNDAGYDRVARGVNRALRRPARTYSVQERIYATGPNSYGSVNQRGFVSSAMLKSSTYPAIMWEVPGTSAMVDIMHDTTATARRLYHQGSGNFSFTGDQVWQFASNYFRIQKAFAVTDHSSSSNLTAAFAVPVLTKTGNYSVTALEGNTWINNDGASGAVTNTLPAAFVGRQYGFAITAAQMLVIKAAGTDTIRILGTVSAGGGQAATNVVGTTLHLHCPVNGSWVADSQIGAWAVQ